MTDSSSYIGPILINGTLVVILGFFIKMWINGLKSSIDKLERDLGKKVDITVCERAHSLVDRQAHTHGTLGSAGEVITKG